MINLRLLRVGSPAIASRSPCVVFRRSQQTASSRKLSDDLVVVNNSKDGVTTITLNTPKNFNALTVEMGDRFKDAVRRVGEDRSVRVVVLTGAGKAFSAGGDLDFLINRASETPQNNSLIMRQFYQRFLEIRKLPVPVISAINGAAVGAGLCLAMATDLRIAAKEARLGVTFAGLGIHPGMGATFFLPKLLGNQIASRLLLTGELIDGVEAERIGMVLQAVDADKVLPTAQDMARRIADQSSVAVQTCVRTLRTNQETGLEAALWREADSQAICYASPDLKEGVAAVREKRKPNFRHA
eukprot:TRINITY_DN1732_c0_g1_i2.p2 TRINITY_DN1732_c0_g1~~TRINITY_DN1732_c0_g1_i2.p2  ORF type:complete len:315 (+),score=29.76 TRINITY_DN1732_c0_g1_i2:53-946(+)